MKNIKIKLPLDKAVISSLRSGQKVLLSGEIYTARDAAHKHLISAIENKEKLPIPLENQVIFYVGPSPAPPGHKIGAAGPTTSYRMDDFTVQLLEKGLKGMIGKGQRADFIKKALTKFKAVYFVAIGGAATLYSNHIKAVEIIAYPELGTEAIRKLKVVDFPCYVAYDIYGNDIFENRNNGL